MCGLDAVRACARRLLDSESLSCMSPLHHLDWALSLPPGDEGRQLPGFLRELLLESTKIDEAELSRLRVQALSHWRRRKAELDPVWAERFRALPVPGDPKTFV